MNILDEGNEIFALRVDQNKGAFFKCHLAQPFYKGEITVVYIEQDYNELNIHGNTVYKVIARDNETDVDFLWQKFENCENVHVTYKQPNKSETEQLNDLLNDESIWS